ncbi:MAG: response regulator [Chloroherpetonaceae bacterium]|nr:response regulator [Chloroherpetonaceae bacterium]
MIRKMLLADDDRDIHFYVQSVLQTSWLSIKSVYNGKDALKEFEAMDYDLILTDLSMPEMNGVDLIKALFQSKFKVPPVVVLSSMSDTSLIVKCLSAGVSDYIIKPAEPSRIRKTVYGILHLDESGNPVAQRPLSSYMGEMTMMKLTGKLLLDDGKNTGVMYYEEGKLKQIQFAGLTGLEALEAAKRAKFLNVSFAPSNPVGDTK